MSSTQSEIVVIGGGIIGVCTAYYLLKSTDVPANARVTLIENTAIACGASGKAAGFIASGPDWHDSANKDLARLSFEAFAQLSEEFGGEVNYGWRRCSAVGIKVGTGQDEMSSYRQLPQSSGAGSTTDRVDWVNGERTNVSGVGGLGQMWVSRVHPLGTALVVEVNFAIASPVPSAQPFTMPPNSSVCEQSSPTHLSDAAMSSRRPRATSHTINSSSVPDHGHPIFARRFPSRRSQLVLYPVTRSFLTLGLCPTGTIQCRQRSSCAGSV